MAENTFTCPYCGTLFKLSDVIGWDGTRRKGFAGDGMCPSCVQWNSLAKRMDKGLEVMNGVAFVPEFIQFGISTPSKSVWAIRQDGTLMRFWQIKEYYGEIPSVWRHMFPDTLKQVPSDMIRNHRGYNGKCNHKGCLGRLQCYWYDMALETNPFNVIPENCEENIEECPSYINKHHLSIVF